MGGLFSRPADTISGALFSKPWRDVPKNSQENLDFLKSYKPRNKEVKHLRILLVGPVGAGKSSFFNSVDSVLQNRITGRALTDAVDKGSITQKNPSALVLNSPHVRTPEKRPKCRHSSFKKGTYWGLQYETYKISKDSEGSYAFVFIDTMGFEKPDESGVLVEDIKLALKGHVKDGYKFKPEEPLQEGDFYNSSPTLDDRVHVLVFVLSVDSPSIMSPEIVKKMREVRLAASDMRIPQLVILTKIDETCPEVTENTNNAYKSKYLKELVDKCSPLLGVPLNCIFLVKNYHSEIKITEDINALILVALRQMISFGEDFLNHLQD